MFILDPDNIQIPDEIRLILIYGISGSGKTTLAKKIEAIHPDFEIFEADQYFEDEFGGYHYDRSLIKKAHESCRNRTQACLVAGGRAIVSNTSCQPFEREPYLLMAGKEQIAVHLCEGEFGSVHDIPDEIIERQKANLKAFSENEL